MPRATSSYSDPRAHALWGRYQRTFGGPEIPVLVEAIAEDLLGLRVEVRLLAWLGMLLPAERTVVLNLAESPRNDPLLRRHRFTIAHEIGHWVCHCLEGRAAQLERATAVRPTSRTTSTERSSGRRTSSRASC